VASKNIIVRRDRIEDAIARIKLAQSYLGMIPLPVREAQPGVVAAIDECGTATSLLAQEVADNA